MHMNVVSNVAKLAVTFGLALLILTPPTLSWAQGARKAQHQTRSARPSTTNAVVRSQPPRQAVSSGRSGVSSQDWTAMNGAGP